MSGNEQLEFGADVTEEANVLPITTEIEENPEVKAALADIEETVEKMAA